METDNCALIGGVIEHSVVANTVAVFFATSNSGDVTEYSSAMVRVRTIG